MVKETTLQLITKYFVFVLTERQKDRKTERQKDRKTERQKETERQKDRKKQHFN